MQREVVFHNSHVLVIIKIHFFIYLIEDTGLSRAIGKSLEESFLFLMKWEGVRICE